ncbi:hypothetical protein CYY_007171 [Polysphondylium violaceum]|uniref:Calcium-transporting ATPase n=1 Tax=Polysphondylium violaceum TaxID=133409 RepID=A0A8J4PRC2_9MYCE|nr:hypothetical protein CYY_007171 [Polysphondylium violaceum]
MGFLSKDKAKQEETELEGVSLEHLQEEFPLDVTTLGKLVDVPKGFDLYAELGHLNGLEKSLRTDKVNGLPVEEDSLKQIRIQRYSKNILPPPPHQPLYSIVLDALSDHILILLIVAAAISIVLGSIKYTSHDPKTGWIDGVAILVAVVIVVSVTSFNDFRNQARFRELNDKTSDKQVKAIRGGEQCLISIFDVQVGDVIILDTGDIICADGVFIDGHALRCDESSITGESDPIKKGHPQDHLDPFLISGSLVLEGVGKMLVTAVGVHSFNGKTMMGLRVASEDTPLQKKLAHLAENIGKFGLSAAILLLLIAIPKYFIERKVNDTAINSDAASDITKLVIGSITIVVVAVPEGLPLAVTMALAYGMMKMYRENNLVRNLASCETMGSATTICSDKTGTLTQNVMTVVTGTICGVFQQVDEEFLGRLSPTVIQILCDGIALNSNAYEGHSSNGKLEFIGSKTECALLNFCKNFGNFDYVDIRKRINVEQLYPFSSARKRMSVLISNGDSQVRLYSKGASEIVLGMSNRYIDERGNIQPMSAQAKAMFEENINLFASDALRTIGLAYRDMDRSESDFVEPPENNLIFIGIVGIKDPLRPEVPDAVEQCKKAGITVRMVTGDNIVTATNIARNCGILTEGGLCMEGPVFRELPQEEMDAILPKLQVLARSSPTDKQLLVGRLKDLGEVVAVTGDGTNDGPALKLANVGFSMGISGTEVAIAASDVVLLDDNFASIVRAVLWGRNIYDAICKFLQFQLTVNVVAVTIAFIGTLTGTGESPLTAVQLLWVNLIMDTLAALALATEPPTPELLDRPPNGKDAPLITKTMWRNIIGQSALQLAILFTLLYQGHNIYSDITGKHVEKDSRHHYTILFNTFVFLQLFNEINCRILGDNLNPFRGIFSNWIFSVVLIGTLGVQIIFVTFGDSATSTDPLSVAEWFLCIFTGLVCMPFNVLLRLIPIKDDSSKNKRPEISEAVYTPQPVNHGDIPTNPIKLDKEVSSVTPSGTPSIPQTGSVHTGSELDKDENAPLVDSYSVEDLSIPANTGANSNPTNTDGSNKPTQVGRGWQIIRQHHKKLVVINAFKEFKRNQEGEPGLVDVVRRSTRNSLLLPSNTTYANLNI